MNRRDQRSTEAQAYRPWYNTTRWRKRRAEQLKGEPLCRMCLPGVVPATVADHVKDHKGDYDLFWFGELQSLCATHHSSVKQAQELGQQRIEVDESGWPREAYTPQKN